MLARIAVRSCENVRAKQLGEDATPKKDASFSPSPSPCPHPALTLPSPCPHPALTLTLSQRERGSVF
jgi:hypothetical protein